jgi:hypothetical protein
MEPASGLPSFLFARPHLRLREYSQDSSRKLVSAALPEDDEAAERKAHGETNRNLIDTMRRIEP